METRPVTAIVPTHNRPDLMKAAVLSIINQSYEGPIEIIVVFDACEPVLPDVELPGNRTLTAKVNERTRGLAGARNTGILAASHDLVAFLDDDDEWFPTKLVQQIALLETEPDAILVGTAMVVDDGERRHERLIPVQTVTHEALLRDRMAGLHSSSFVFSRDAMLGPLGLVDEDLPGSYGEDYDLLLRTAKVGKIAFVNTPQVMVRWQGQSLFFGKWDRYAIALEYLLTTHPEFSADRRALARIESQIAFAHAASGQRTFARKWAGKAIKHDVTKVRSYLALAVSTGVISADTIAKAAQRVGKGI